MQEKNYLLWKKAEEQYCLGNFDAAKQMYNELTSDDQYFIKAHQRISSLSVSEHQLDINNLVLVYQTGKKYCSSMVKLLIRNIPLIGEVEDYSDEVCHQHLYTKFYSNMIVVDHAIKSIESYQYYLKCKLSGCNVILIHLADEGYQDIYEIYDFCSLVLGIIGVLYLMGIEKYITSPWVLGIVFPSNTLH